LIIKNGTSFFLPHFLLACFSVPAFVWQSIFGPGPKADLRWDQGQYERLLLPPFFKNRGETCRLSRVPKTFRTFLFLRFPFLIVRVAAFFFVGELALVSNGTTKRPGPRFLSDEPQRFFLSPVVWVCACFCVYCPGHGPYPCIQPCFSVCKLWELVHYGFSISPILFSF